jgi:hypothetical protein
MSVRPTQTKSGYPRRTRAPYPTDDQGRSSTGEPDPALAADPVGPDPEPAATVSETVPQASASMSRVAERRAERAVRRTRRNVAIVCGLVVAACLILTILIVNMARIRTSGPQVVVSPAVGLVGPSRPGPAPFVPIHQPILDAPASEGGNP